MSSDETCPVDVGATGRYIVTFRKGAKNDVLAALKKGAGLSKTNLMSSLDFGDAGVNVAQVPEEGGVLFEHLGIAVISVDEAAVGALVQDSGQGSAILAVESEGIMYALGGPALTLDYLRGFRDAANSLYSQISQNLEGATLAEIAASFGDTAAFTWGLQATKVAMSRFSGKGIRVAVLDTGLDLMHPDFVGRNITAKSFISGVDSVQDGHGHGTHCIGTACGSRQPGQGRRYGVAYGSEIYVGKVLSDQGRGGDMSILAGIDWAVANKCQIISMSLGAPVCNTSIAYETAGQRALDAGTLIVAAAGNDSRRSIEEYGCVGRPANSRTMMAVAALDANLKVADFSNRDVTQSSGTAVDIAAPGVAVYSAWPMPTRTRSINGTSMATPHVAGIAALWAEATGASGAALWQHLIANACSLSAPVIDVGRGLVQAP